MGYSAPISNSNLNVQMDSVVLIGFPPSHSIGSASIFLILFAVKTILSDSPWSIIEPTESLVRITIGKIGLVESELVKPVSNLNLICSGSVTATSK